MQKPTQSKGSAALQDSLAATLLTEESWMRSVARALLQDLQAVDDVVQETVLAALRRAPSRDRSLRPWLGTVLRNQVWKRRQRDAQRTYEERAHSSQRPEASLPSPEEMALHLEQRQELVACLQSLEEPYRSTLLLRFFEERTPSEIASGSGIPAGTVRWRLSKGLELLRERLDERHGGDRGAWCLALLPLLQREHGLAASTGSSAVFQSTLALPLLVKAAAVALPLTILTAIAFQKTVPQGGPFHLPIPPAVASKPDRAERLVPQMIPVPRTVAADSSRSEVSKVGSPARTPDVQIRIHGLVRDTRRHPMEGVTVTATLAKSGKVLRAEADSKGAYTLVGTSLGTYEIRLDPTSLPEGFSGSTEYGHRYRSTEQDLWDLECKHANLELVAEAPEVVVHLTAFELGSVQGRLVDAAGRPIEGADVQLGNPCGSQDLQTGADGVFTALIRSGAHYLNISTQRASLPSQRGLNHPRTRGFEISPGGFLDLGTFQLGLPGTAVVGRLVDQYGQAITGRRVLAYPKGGAWHQEVDLVETGTDGSFVMTVPEGEYLITYDSSSGKTDAERMAGFLEEPVEIRATGKDERIDLGVRKLVRSEPCYIEGEVHAKGRAGARATLIPVRHRFQPEEQGLPTDYRYGYRHGISLQEGRFQWKTQAFYGPIEIFAVPEQTVFSEADTRRLLADVPEARRSSLGEERMRVSKLSSLARFIPDEVLSGCLSRVPGVVSTTIYPERNEEDDPLHVVLEIPW